MFDEATMQIIKAVAVMIPAVAAIVGAVVSWVFNRTMNRFDEMEKRVSQLEKNCNEEDIKNLLLKIEKLQEELNEVRVNYIHKQDFIREMAKLDNKVEKILDIITEMERRR